MSAGVKQTDFISKQICESVLLVDHVFVLEDEIDLSCCRWSLQLLAIQHLFLQFLDGLNEIRTKTC